MVTSDIVVFGLLIASAATTFGAWRVASRIIKRLARERDSLRDLLVLSDDACAAVREELADARKLVAAQLSEINLQNVRIAAYVSADAKRTAQREAARKLALAAVQRRKAARLARIAAEDR